MKIEKRQYFDQDCSKTKHWNEVTRKIETDGEWTDDERNIKQRCEVGRKMKGR